jgi:hypothetical protein
MTISVQANLDRKQDPVSKTARARKELEMWLKW